MSVASHNHHPIHAAEASRTDVLGMQEVRQVEAAEFDNSAQIYPPEAIGLTSIDSGSEVTVVGELVLQVDNPGQGIKNKDAHAAILRLKRPHDKKITYVLQGLETDEAGNATANGHFLRIDHTGMSLGRNADRGLVSGNHTPVAAESLWGKGFVFDEGTSREHLTLTSFGPRLFLHETSTNGTRVKGDLSVQEKTTHAYEHTISASELARRRNMLSDSGEFGGRKVITRNTTIGPKGEATVDIRSWGAGAEAIVVDPEKDPEPYQELLDAMLHEVDLKRKWGQGPVTEEDVVAAIYRTVSTSMTYDLDYVNQVSKAMEARDDDYRKINLSFYLAEKKGVCRQMALAAAWLGSEAADRGMLRGRMTAEVNQRIRDNAAHEWARYTSPSGEVFIIDPAQRYFGRLENIHYRQNRWEYFRPGEKETYMQRFGGGMALDGTQIDIQLEDKS